MKNPYESPREQGLPCSRVKLIAEAAPPAVAVVAGLVGFVFFAAAVFFEMPGRPAWSDVISSLGCLFAAAVGADCVRFAYHKFKDSNQ